MSDLNVLGQDGSFFSSLKEKSAAPVNSRNIAPSDLHFAKFYLDYSKSGPSIQTQLLSMIAQGVTEELLKCFEWFSSEAKLDEAHVEFALRDSTELLAQAIPKGGKRNCDILVGLGCLAKFLGIANRMRNAMFGGVVRFSFQLGHFPQLKQEKWRPQEDPIGMLVADDGVAEFRHTAQIVIDAMLLLLLHEAAHFCRGHMWIENKLPQFKPHEFRRAMESDADWGSGYLFLLWAAKKSPEDWAIYGPNKDSVIERLTLASECLYFAFQLYANNERVEPRYHLPYTRAIDTLEGASVAWAQLGKAEDFSTLVNDAYSKLGLIERIMPSVFESWIKYDEEKSVNDIKIRNTISIGILQNSVIRSQLQSLELSPLKGVR